jgi:hypothetical protein
MEIHFVKVLEMQGRVVVASYWEIYSGAILREWGITFFLFATDRFQQKGAGGPGYCIPFWELLPEKLYEVIRSAKLTWINHSQGNILQRPRIDVVASALFCLKYRLTFMPRSIRDPSYGNDLEYPPVTPTVARDTTERQFQAEDMCCHLQGPFGTNGCISATLKRLWKANFVAKFHKTPCEAQDVHFPKPGIIFRAARANHSKKSPPFAVTITIPF